jgi:hypothetical protein
MAPDSLGVFFTLAGVALLIGSAGLFLRTRHLLLNFAATTGTVTEVSADEDVTPDHDECYFYVVEFHDGTGQPVRLRCPSGMDPPPYREGQRVSLLYEPEHPTRAVVNSFPTLWYSVLALLGTGAAFLGGGLRLLVG